MAPHPKRPGPRLLVGRQLKFAFAATLVSLFRLTSATAGDEPPATKPIDFAHDIAPLIKAHCAKCHTDGTYKGSFSLDTRETMLKSEAVVPGKSGESELIERLTSDDPEFRMPPKGTRLTAGEVGRLKAWIDQRAPWEAGFTFKRAGYTAPLKLRTPQAARPPATAAIIRSTASSTPISPRTESRRPRRSTTRRLLAGCSST